MGRGSSGTVKRYGGGGGLNPGDIVNEEDMVSGLAEGPKRAETADVLSVARQMVDAYGDDTVLHGFNVATLKPKASMGTLAYYDGANVAFNERYFDAQKLAEVYADSVRSGFHPSNGSKTAIQAVAAHEYGHALTDVAARKMGITGFMALHSAADRIVNEARRLTTSRGVVQMAQKISGYATHSNAETIAEAVADVYCNGWDAKPESRAVVYTLNKYLK